MDTDLEHSYISERKRHAGDKHIPNKTEAALLRRLMSETGKNEEEIREIKKYRIMLSEAQVLGTKPKRSFDQKQIDKCMKIATRQTGLAKEHPETLEKFREVWVSHRFRLDEFAMWYDPYPPPPNPLKKR